MSATVLCGVRPGVAAGDAGFSWPWATFTEANRRPGRVAGSSTLTGTPAWRAGPLLTAVMALALAAEAVALAVLGVVGLVLAYLGGLAVGLVVGIVPRPVCVPSPPGSPPPLHTCAINPGGVTTVFFVGVLAIGVGWLALATVLTLALVWWRLLRPAAPEPRSPVPALLLSLVVPGLGTMRNGDVGRGVIILVFFLASACFVPMLVGLPLLIVVWAWGLLDAVLSARRWNRHLRPAS